MGQKQEAFFAVLSFVLNERMCATIFFHMFAFKHRLKKKKKQEIKQLKAKFFPQKCKYRVCRENQLNFERSRSQYNKFKEEEK